MMTTLIRSKKLKETFTAEDSFEVNLQLDNQSQAVEMMQK